MKAIRIILSCIKKADKEYNLINDGDRICVGISGGKDSLVLFYGLHLYKRYSKINFEIVPSMIDLGFDGFDPTNTINFINSLGYKLDLIDGKNVFDILKIQQELQKTSHLPCSICSKMKKAIINKEAHKLKCNKVAFAHHKDDAIETLLLNSIYGGRLATFSPKMFLSGEKITFIRPLVLAKEADIKMVCEEENITISPSHCPNDKYTEREEVKKILNLIYEKYPSSIENFISLLSNDSKEDLFYMHQEFKILNTQYYYKLTRNILDYSEELKFSNANPTTKIEKESKHLVLYKENKIQCVILIAPYKLKRTFIINRYNYLNNESFIAFLNELIEQLFIKYNPTTLFIKARKKDEEILNELGFVFINKNLAKKIINKK